MPSSLEVLRYAIEQRNYVAVIGLIIQERWVRRSFTQFARLSGYGVIVLGITLIVFSTVVLARDAVPAFAAPGTQFYRFLMFLVVTVSFNILFNYICATTFSLRLGKANPATMAKKCRQEQRQLWRRDGSESSLSSSPSQSSAGDNAHVERGEDAAAAAHRHPQHLRDGSSAPLTATEPGDSQTCRNGNGTGTADGLGVIMSQHRCTQREHGSSMTTAPPLPRSHQSASKSSSRTATPSRAPVRRRFSLFTHRAKQFLARTNCQLLACLSTTTSGAARRDQEGRGQFIDSAVAAELERLTMEMEAYTATERRYKLLDAPRRFCKHCQRLKAPREHHCSVCNTCVAQMDHHCPFLNSCVDGENLRYFALFIFWLWTGTGLVNLFIGYATVQQWWYERQRGAAAGGALPVAPYGPRGVKLTSFSVTLTLSLSVVMFLCMCLFLYENVKQLLDNTTAIETAIIHDKQQRLFRGTGFQYRSPYNLGSWRNFLECFRTLDDPAVRCELAPDACRRGRQGGPRTAGDDEDALRSPLLRPRPTGLVATTSFYAWRAVVLCWLTALPTLRPTGRDGVHYPMFDKDTRDASGYCLDGRHAREEGAVKRCIARKATAREKRTMK